MGESLTTEHAYVGMANFPVVEVTECGVLSDAERTQVMEHLEGLIDAGQRHAVVLDLSEGETLPEAQREYVGTALRTRAKDFAKTWSALAIVVDGPESRLPAKAEFWVSASPAPARVFPSFEAAQAWARESMPLDPTSPSAPVSSPSPSPDRSSRASRIAPLPRPGRNSLPSKPAAIPAATSGRPSGPAAKGKPPEPGGLKGFLTRPRGIAVLASVAIVGLLLVLGPAREGSLSASEARAFEKLKAGLTVRVYRQTPAKVERLTPGQKTAPGDKLGVEIDVPAVGYLLLAGVGPDGSAYSLWPAGAQSAAGQVRAGGGLRLPGSFKLSEALGQQTLHVAYCPEAFTTSDCKASGTSFTCPEGCVTSDFVLSQQ